MKRLALSCGLLDGQDTCAPHTTQSVFTIYIIYNTLNSFFRAINYFMLLLPGPFNLLQRGYIGVIFRPPPTSSVGFPSVAQWSLSLVCD
jgi:hypothetical protein